MQRYYYFLNWQNLISSASRTGDCGTGERAGRIGRAETGETNGTSRTGERILNFEF